MGKMPILAHSRGFADHIGQPIAKRRNHTGSGGLKQIISCCPPAMHAAIARLTHQRTDVLPELGKFGFICPIIKYNDACSARRDARFHPHAFLDPSSPAPAARASEIF